MSPHPWSRRSLVRAGVPRLALALALLGGVSSAQALCLSALNCSCNVTTTNLNFGSYNPLAFGNLDTTGTITVRCTSVAGLLIPYTLEINKGGGTSFATRRMAYSTYQLSYNLYTDNSYTTVWGDGTSSTVKVSGGLLLELLNLSPSFVHTVYGRIPGRQLTVAPGTYTDSLTVTLTYD